MSYDTVWAISTKKKCSDKQNQKTYYVIGKVKQSPFGDASKKKA